MPHRRFVSLTAMPVSELIWTAIGKFVAQALLPVLVCNQKDAGTGRSICANDPLEVRFAAASNLQQDAF